MLSHEDWFNFIDVMTSYASKSPLTTIKFQNVPKQLGIQNSQVTLYEALQKIKEYARGIMKKGDLKVK